MLLSQSTILIIIKILVVMEVIISVDHDCRATSTTTIATTPSWSTRTSGRRSRFSVKRRRQDNLVDEDTNRIGDQDDEIIYSTWTLDLYPNPVLVPQYCRVNGFSSNVCDPDDVLSQKQKRHLNMLIRSIGSDSKCYCSSCAIDKHGVNIGIAVAKSIFRPYNVLPLNNTAEFADSLRRKWKLGICDNDILILLTTSDRLWYVAYGSAARRIFPSDSLEQITENNKNFFSSGRYYDGLESMITQIHAKLIDLETNPYSGPQPHETESNVAIITGVSFLVILIAIIIALCVWFFRSSRKDGPPDRRVSLSESEKLRSEKELEAEKDRAFVVIDPKKSKSGKNSSSSSNNNNNDGNSWMPKCVSKRQESFNNNSTNSNNSYKAKTKIRPKHSSIEEDCDYDADQREPDEVDEKTPVSLNHAVYNETTIGLEDSS